MTRPIELLPGIVAHELIHAQQRSRGSDEKLLAQSIIEGSADFIGEIISEQNFDSHLKVYGDAREPELWEAFKREMHDKNVSNWLYNAASAKDRPADLGYYIGYKICESYYNRAKNKKRAIEDILTIKDFDRFLEESRYEEKFADGSYTKMP
ncbi:hypothetical protein IH992_07705 [Candidatus Poribacteria bacterium]|nr:hypothetical protein [Candidatus Poribacteria bacterium]